MPHVASLINYPIKSCTGNSLQQSKVNEYGLELDRHWLITDTSGRMLTGRTHPKINQLRVTSDKQPYYLQIPEQAALSLDIEKWRGAIEVNVWGSSISAIPAPDAINQGLSTFLETPCLLSFFGESSQRFVKQRSSQVAFADAYPILIVSQASLDELNRRSPEPISMDQFRPNIVIQGVEAFAEDNWQKIRIGEIEYELCGASSRCVFTTLKPGTEHYSEQKEPLTTLQQFRKGASGEVYFGENALALTSGQIALGDKVEILETKVPERYPDLGQVSESKPTTASPVKSEVSILFDSWDTLVKGNTTDTVLDQAEDAGLDIPFSCRSGSCGTCRMKLESGEVEVLEDSGLSPQEIDDGYILSCSCLPKSDLVLTSG